MLVGGGTGGSGRAKAPRARKPRKAAAATDGGGPVQGSGRGVGGGSGFGVEEEEEDVVEDVIDGAIDLTADTPPPHGLGVGAVGAGRKGRKGSTSGGVDGAVPKRVRPTQTQAGRGSRGAGAAGVGASGGELTARMMDAAGLATPEGEQAAAGPARESFPRVCGLWPFHSWSLPNPCHKLVYY